MATLLKRWALSAAVTVLTALFLTSSQTSACTFDPAAITSSIKCEPITMSRRCSSVGYQNTSFPNIFNHSSQEQAAAFFQEYIEPFLYLNCSSYLEHFLCATVFPLCVERRFSRIEPCRELCVSVRESCTQKLRDVGREWPSQLECSQFVPHGSQICIWKDQSLCDDTVVLPTLSTPGNGGSAANSGSKHTCTKELALYPNNSGTDFGGIANCAEPCQGVYFDQSQQNFALIWITALSLVCLFISIVAFLTYVLDCSRIKSPDSSVYFIALCYAFVSLAYVVSVVVGKDKLICNDEFTNEKNESALVIQGAEMPLCGVIFSTLYYFTLCTWTWWAVLSFEWFLCSLKSTSIQFKLQVCFHIVAWGVPLILLVIVLLLKRVSGDPVLRTCWVSKHSEMPFLIVPLLIIVLLCSFLIIVSFTRVVRLQQRLKGANVERSKVIKLSALIRVGIYSTVHLLPMGLLICAYWYEYWYRSEWETWYLECVNADTRSDCTNEQRPMFAIFMAKFTASLIMGILTVLWIMKKSSLLAWRRAFCVCQEGTISSSSNNDLVTLRFESDSHPSSLTFRETSV